MDISKASNFERMIFDAVNREGATVRQLWSQVDKGEGIKLDAAAFERVKGFGFVSGRSTHADRMRTIRDIHSRYGELIDTHTADGIKVGLEHREPNVPLICLETALPAKFEEAIREALGQDPVRPPGFENIESLPQRVAVVDNDAATVKQFIVEHT